MNAAGVLSVLLVVANVRQSDAVAGLPVFQIGFTLRWSRAAYGLVGLAQDVSVLRIYEPAHGHAFSAYVEDLRIHCADFFVAGGGEDEGWVVQVLSDVNQVTLDLG